MPRSFLGALLLLALDPAASVLADSPFATRVLEYSPAPGQRVQDPAFNDPTRALGPPPGAGGLAAADNSKVVTLGGFGGSITLGFDHPIWRNRHNPRGVDFIVFANAFFVAGDPTRRYAEPGVIEVSRDVNANGLADDQWFVIRGSYQGGVGPLTRTSKSYSAAALTPTWVPPGRTGTWTQSAYPLPPLNPPIVNSDPVIESVWGYADLAPTVVLGDTDLDDLADDPLATPASFYVVPDDPRRVGITPGSGGGSGIAIAWAAVPSTGQPANLDRIDFVRISTSIDFISPILGEVSTEVSGVGDVAPVYRADWNADNAVSVQDVFDFLADWFAGVGEHGGADFNASGSTTVQDIFDFLSAWFNG